MFGPSRDQAAGGRQTDLTSRTVEQDIDGTQLQNNECLSERRDRWCEARGSLSSNQRALTRKKSIIGLNEVANRLNVSAQAASGSAQ
jgi:hypothetical protein